MLHTELIWDRKVEQIQRQITELINVEGSYLILIKWVVIGQTAKPVQQDDIHNNFNAIIEVLLDHPDVGKRSPIKKINETSGRAENISKEYSLAK